MNKPHLTGIIKTWKEDRGFGFISPDNGSRDIFIHISALGEMTQQPSPGDIISYRIARDKNGKYRAVNASIEGKSNRHRSDEQKLPGKFKRSILIISVLILLIVIVGVVILNRNNGVENLIP
jgi:cold shock CspA family protein